jgi:hypothetical protein
LLLLLFFLLRDRARDREERLEVVVPDAG